MKTKLETHSEDTQPRLLAAAAEVFAEQGYHQATVRGICQRAQANVAAVNYHFGDKAELYRAVFRHWFERVIRRYPPTMGLGERPTPEDRLRAFVRSLLFRVLDSSDEACPGSLLMKELSSPTGLLDDMIKESLFPVLEILGSIMTDLMGEETPEETVRNCCRSVVGQCLYYRHAQPFIRVLDPKQHYDHPSIDLLAEHITDFSLAAIHALAKKKKGRSR